MASEGVSVRYEAGSRPLNFFHSTLNEHELEHVWAEFEAKLPNLFVTEADNCKVEIVEIISPSESSPQRQAITGEYIESDDKGNVSKWASTVEELNIILTVYHPPLIIALLFSNLGMTCSKSYCLTLQGCCG